MTVDGTINSLFHKKRLSLGDLQKSELWVDLQTLFNQGITHPRQLLFHYKNKLTNIPLCACGNKLEWNADFKKYREYCSRACTAHFTIATKKENNLKKLGVEWHTQTKEWKEKVIQTSVEKFGAEHFSKTQEFKNSVTATNLEKYGVEYASQNKDIMQKIHNTNLEKYGTQNYFASTDARTKIAQTVLDRYGVVNPQSNSHVRQNYINSMISKYGEASPLKVKAIVSKMVNSRRAKLWAPDILAKLDDHDWLTEQNSTITVNELANNIGISPSQLCKIYHQHNIPIQRHAKTELERKITNFFIQKGIKVIANDRVVLCPKEIDIFFPDYNLGIEINGAYWHSTQFKKDKNYHLNKTIHANENGIELLQYWDWELEDKWDIAISTISHKLGLSTKLYARKLYLVSVSDNEKNEFLNKSHIQGTCQSKINIGLCDENKRLIMLGTFGKSRFSKTHTWELLRLASLPFFNVVGGASRILHTFFEHHMNQNDKIISYCHRRFSSGGVYKALSFNVKHITGPGFVYTHKGEYAGSRNQWQKHMLHEKLKIFSPSLSENANMENNGYYRLWDCGQIVFEKQK